MFDFFGRLEFDGIKMHILWITSRFTKAQKLNLVEANGHHLVI